ncbi:MAG TPA: helix-turn-helix domain-containing protein [Nevskiales bacterium]|nr:helix-turn-helix domain-containing protein [Nevskiales bacterium]
MQAQTRRCGFLLLPGFSSVSFMAACEPLRLANALSGEPLYRVLTLGCSRAAVAGAEERLLPDYAIAMAPPLDALFVCAAPGSAMPADARALLQWLCRLAAAGTALGGVHAGSYWLARAGLLDGYRCTIHWPSRAMLRRMFPQLIVSASVFEIDRDRYTCGGGSAARDMMLHLVAREQGDPALVAVLAQALLYQRVRAARAAQRHGFGDWRPPKLSRALALMAANVEEPLALAEIARRVGSTLRQVERLFQAHLGCAPADYYRELRLLRARCLLLRTAAPVLDVALACGFSSGSHFARRYRERFGVVPSGERRVPANLVWQGAKVPFYRGPWCSIY